MAYNEFLVDRVAQFFREKSIHFNAKKMFGGFVFMIDDKMCVGVMKDQIMARINPDIFEKSILKEGCKPMDFTGKKMKGFVYLNDEAIDLEDDLHYWLQLALDFNPLAKASKKRKSSKS